MISLCLRIKVEPQSKTVCLYFILDYDTVCLEYEVRLAYREQSSANGNSATGNLEICVGGVWRSVCADEVFRQAEVDVACRALGFNDFEGSDVRHTLISPIVVDSETLIFNGAFACEGFEESFSVCLSNQRKKRGAAGSRCTHATDVRLQCLGKH